VLLEREALGGRIAQPELERGGRVDAPVGEIAARGRRREASAASKNFAASSTMSMSVFLRSSRLASASEYFGSGMPACSAGRSTASGNDTPSVSITKSKILPFLPAEKSNHIAFWSLTKNEGVRS
jgi:hypothetical protein